MEAYIIASNIYNVYYAVIMLPLNVYYADINLSCYYVAIVSLLCYYYAAINLKIILYCYYVDFTRIFLN